MLVPGSQGLGLLPEVLARSQQGVRLAGANPPRGTNWQSALGAGWSGSGSCVCCLSFSRPQSLLVSEHPIRKTSPQKLLGPLSFPTGLGVLGG